MGGKKGYRREKVRKRLTYGVIVVAFLVVCFLVYSFLHPSNQTPSNQTIQKAALVDHLSISEPNETFKQTSMDFLREGFSAIDYYSGHDVTIKFYRNLPLHSYSLIVFRVHSAIIENTKSIGLFTNEFYSDDKAAAMYSEDMQDKRIVKCFFTEGGPEYFGIAPRFVEKSMIGEFPNTIIIMMGCDGLTYDTMAKAFITKGAKVYIGWNGLVGVAHTDQATIHLLQHLVTERQTVKKAVSKTMEEVGQDPEHKSELQYYGVEDHVIPTAILQFTAKDTETSVICVPAILSRIFSLQGKKFCVDTI